MLRPAYSLVAAIVVALAGQRVHAQLHAWPFEQVLPNRGRLGVQVQPMTAELREHFNAPADRGLLVTRVEADRPAARAGVRVGDVIVTAGGVPMREPFDLVKAVGRVPAGETLELRLFRDREERAVSVQPDGAATPWVDPDYWGKWVEKGLRHGSGEFRRRLRELERRLEELERKFEEQRPREGEEQRT